jgi:hypothetical protein
VKDFAPLWHWTCEREAIRIRKEKGLQFPWTDDPILSTYRFCCVRREDDRVTRWVRVHIRERFAVHPALWWMLCAARVINWPDTLAELIATPGAWPSHDNFTPARMGEVLQARADRGDKVWTGAYVITAPSEKGAKKAQFVADVTLGKLWARRAVFDGMFARNTVPRMRDVHQDLMRFDGWGPFMAYQAIVDMRFTRLLDGASDVESWAAAGPGTIRGLNRLHGRPTDFSLPQDRALDEIRSIFAMTELETGVAIDFSDVPNMLCETDKYLRVKLGEGKPRALYVPGRGA